MIGRMSSNVVVQGRDCLKGACFVVNSSCSCFGCVALFAFSSITLAATEGYLSQPAMHGNTVVFVSEGDLWRADLSDDLAQPVRASRLTRGAGAESAPVFSSDGATLAFAGVYGGNTDVYVMRVDGGAPTRLTHHPEADVPLAVTNDGRIAFKSARSSPLHDQELWFVSVDGGMQLPAGFGECSLASFNPDGSMIAFNRWSNERWYWRGYRGGTAPEVWIGKPDGRDARRLTNDRANDLFPNFILDRVAFLSDRDGTTNVWTDRMDGGDLQQVTRFVDAIENPTAIEGYQVRWLRADAKPQSPRMIFAQGGALGIVDIKSGEVLRPAITLLSDRAATLPYRTDLLSNISGFSLSPTGKTMAIDARGDAFVVVPPADPAEGSSTVTSVPSPATRESDVVIVEDNMIMLSDDGGEQFIAGLKNGSGTGFQRITMTSGQWIVSLAVDLDGKFAAYGDRALRLHLVDIHAGTESIIDTSAAAEFTDMRFSPDGKWLAYAKQVRFDKSQIYVREVAGGAPVLLSDGMSNDRMPRWDPKVEYLYFVSSRAVDPVMSEIDSDHAFYATDVVMCIPLKAETPPPSADLAKSIDFDLAFWADPLDETLYDATSDWDDASEGAAEPLDPTTRPYAVIELEGIAQRSYQLDIPNGKFSAMEAGIGGLWVGRGPIEGLNAEVWPAPLIGAADKSLNWHPLPSAEILEIADNIATFVVSGDSRTIAWFDGKKLVHVRDASTDELKIEEFDFAGETIEVKPREEWAQIFDEAWRLQRDFFWAENMAGVDWNAMKIRYAALLPLVGTRVELDDVIGQMMGELRTSHAYVMPGEDVDLAPVAETGTLACDYAIVDGAVVITRVLAGVGGVAELESPLAFAHFGKVEGSALREIDGYVVDPSKDVHAFFEGKVGKSMRLGVQDLTTSEARVLTVQPVADESTIRQRAWVKKNREAVARASDGRLGYIYLPDMDGPGLEAFGREFYPQYSMDGMIIDTRSNGGGFVSPQILSVLARKVLAYQKPRNGDAISYPEKVLDGPLVVLIDQSSGSDGDIFPNAFRNMGLGKLIGTRTWGGVTGIRADKPAVDGGVTTQPEYGWFEPSLGWTLENEGVTPDIEVELTPADRANGIDPQLDRAVQELLDALEQQPRVKPVTPPWPLKR